MIDIPLPGQPGGPQPGGLGSQTLNALSSSALNNQLNYLNAKYAPQEKQLGVEHQQLVNQFYPQLTMADIGYKNALASLIPSEIVRNNLANQFYPDLTQAQIDNYKAMSNYRNMGGGSRGVGQSEIMGLQHQLAMEHPEWDAQTTNQAASAYLNGDSTLPDGTPLPVASGLTATMLDQINKRRSTAALVTGNVKANQAETELGVLNDYAQKGLEPYGDTFFGKSPDQIMDSFKSDESSQKKLGQFIASQALQYEIAQNRIRLANGQPGVGSTEELMKLSGQTVNAQYPKLSYAARKEAARYMDEALREGNKARQSIGIGASGAYGKKDRGEGQMQGKSTETITIRNKKTGEVKTIPASEARKLIGGE